MKKMERNSSRPRLGEKSSFGETQAIQFQITYALCKHFDAREKKKQRAENTNANCQQHVGSVLFVFHLIFLK